MRAALSSAGPIDDELLALGEGAYAWRDVDTELALLAITHDSLTDQGRLVRNGEPPSARTVTLEGADLTVVLEVDRSGILGQIVPPAPCQVAVEPHSGVQTVASADDVGVFSMDAVPVGLYRLRVVCEGRPIAVSDWIRTPLPHSPQERR